MDRDKLIEKLETMNKPEIADPQRQQQLKLTLLNSRRSSAWGVAFIAIPAVFLLLVLLTFWFDVGTGMYQAIESLMVRWDQQAGTKWIFPLLYLGGPVVAIVLNVLAITHFFIDRHQKEIIIAIKYRLRNIIIIAIALLMLFAFFVYAVGENF